MKSKQQKAIDSVELVRSHFKKLGYETTSKNKPNANGHDLVVIKNDVHLRIEVKTAMYSSRAWKVSKSHKLENDFIAIVFNNEFIYFEAWNDHLSKCNKGGQRSLGKIANLYGL